MPRDLDELLERWERKGLLHDGQAELLRAEVAEHDAAKMPDVPVADPGEDRGVRVGEGTRFEAAISAGLEALGYLGSALVIGALAYLTDVAEWPEPALLVMLAGIAMVAGWFVLQWTPAEPGPQSRLVTIIGSAGVAAVLGFFALLLEPWCEGPDCGWASDRLGPFVVVAPGAMAAAWLYLRERNAVTHAWFGIGVGSIVYFVSQAFLPVTADYRSEEVTAALFLLPAALAWIWFTETGRITPAWIGTFAAAWLSAMMVLSLAGFDLFEDRDAAPLALLALGALFVLAGVRFARWRLTLVGSVVALGAIPWTMTEVLHLDERTTALVLLPVGLALIAWVLRMLRRDRKSTVG